MPMKRLELSERQWWKSPWLLRCIGIALFFYILGRIELDVMLACFGQMQWGAFIAAAAFIPVIVVVKAVRWRLLLQAQDLDYPLGKCIEVYSIGVFWGIATPGRLGDFVKVLYLKRRGLNAIHGLLSVVGDRLFDFVSLVALALLSSLIVLKNMEFVAPLVWVLGGGAIGAICVALYLKFRGMPNINGIIAKIVPSEEFGGRQMLARSVATDFNRMLFARFFSVAALTLIGWFCFFSQYYIMLHAAGIAAEFVEVICSTSLAIMAAFLPISIAGLGTRDAVLIVLFEQMQKSSEAAVVLSLIVLFNYCLTGLLGLGIWLNNPLGKSEKI